MCFRIIVPDPDHNSQFSRKKKKRERQEATTVAHRRSSPNHIVAHLIGYGKLSRVKISRLPLRRITPTIAVSACNSVPEFRDCKRIPLVLRNVRHEAPSQRLHVRFQNPTIARLASQPERAFVPRSDPRTPRRLIIPMLQLIHVRDRWQAVPLDRSASANSRSSGSACGNLGGTETR